MTEEKTCPKCGFTGIPVKTNGLSECPECGVFFEKVAPKAPDDEPDGDEQPSLVWPYFLVAAVVIAAIAGSIAGQGYRGVNFILFYLCVLAGGFVALLLFRIFVYDGWFVSLVFCLGFEAVGASRLISAMGRGTEDFGGVGTIMIVGGLLFFLRLHHFGKGRGGAGGCSSCSGGCDGGCGGGCGD